MTARGILLSMLPWVVFSGLISLDGSTCPGVAATGALLTAAVIGFRDRTGGVKVIDVTAVSCFGMVFVAAFAGRPGTIVWLDHYGRGVSTLVLAVVILVSVMTVPFTENYAKSTVPPEVSESPGFRSVHRRLSLIWGGLVVIAVAGHLFAGNADAAAAATGGDWATGLLLNSVLPVALGLIGVIATTSVIKRSVRDEHILDEHGRPVATGRQPVDEARAPS